MKYFVTFGLMAIMLVSIVHMQPAKSQMMCAGGDETFHFTISDIVFIGIVTSINPSDSHRLWNYISFDIQYSFKGLTNQSEIVVPTHQGSIYGFEPEIGSMYLIHASNAYGVDLFTSLCSDNKLLETQQDVEEMKNKLLEISIPPPLKQKQFGLAPHAIKCKENLVLIQKYDGTPACVMESTKNKLIERDWTTKDSSNIPEFDYELGESEFLQIKNNMENIGYHICDIQHEENKVLIVLNWIFEDSEPEKMILSQIPHNVSYEIKYLGGYADYFISKDSVFSCEGLENEN